MLVPIEIAIFALTLCIAERPQIDRSADQSVKVYAVDQPSYPLLSYSSYSHGDQLQVYCCSKSLFSPFFWMWMKIEAPDICQVIVERKTRMTDIAFSLVNEIVWPSPEVVVFRTPIFSKIDSSSLNEQALDFAFGGTIKRREISKSELFRFFVIMGILGMDFSMPIDNAPFGIYLLRANEDIPIWMRQYKILSADFELIAAFVTAPIFQKSATPKQQVEVVRYAKWKGKRVFLRHFKAIQRYFKYPQRGKCK